MYALKANILLVHGKLQLQFCFVENMTHSGVKRCLQFMLYFERAFTSYSGGIMLNRHLRYWINIIPTPDKHLAL